MNDSQLIATMLKALQQTRTALLNLSAEAGDDPVWNRGGIGYDALRVVKRAITAAENR